MTEEWTADVVVVGFGAAGACAAIEAAEAGSDVVVIDRFAGGGSTAMSGGVVYAGGGTTVQREAGVEDSVAAMTDYLRTEIGDAVSEETLRRFCADSPAMVEWLREHGVPFEGSLCPYKTSYPSNRHYLYYSGSEAAGGFRDLATPAPRGHRTKGRGTSGKVLFRALAGAARSAGVRVRPRTRAESLVLDDDGRVAGVEGCTLVSAPAPVRYAHRLLSGLAAKPGLYVPPLAARLHRGVEALERRYGRRVRLHAADGVILAAGGFIANREMVRTHAPSYRGGLPLGTRADDGSGIRLGQQAGGAVERMGSVSAWRFITPPSALLGGLLVDADGHRVCDESRYGAALGNALVTGHGGRGWLLVDADLRRRARRGMRGQTMWFQRLQGHFLLGKGSVTAPTLSEVATRAGVGSDGLAATVEAHNTAAHAGSADPAGKPAEFVRPVGDGPYTLVDVSIRPSVAYPCPMLTLGGLVVDEETGQVRDSRGGVVAGLYAAGRTAVGLCSRSYVSGLSLADCVFSGRRAGARSGRRAPRARRAS